MNSDYMKDYNKQYYQEHKDYYYESAKKWRLSNPQKRKEQAKRYYEKRKLKNNKSKLDEFNELAKKYDHKPIPNFNEYEGFENGAIWSWKFNLFKRQHKRDGYYKVSLMVNTKDARDQMVSRLIASTFDDRTIDELNDLDVHHCNMDSSFNSISNLVYLPHQLHITMHNNLSIELIKSIGEQVKQLRGTAKTNEFCRLVKKELRDFYLQKFKE